MSAIVVVWLLVTGVVMFIALIVFSESSGRCGNEKHAKLAALAFFLSWLWPVALLGFASVLLWNLIESAAGGVMLLFERDN